MSAYICRECGARTGRHAARGWLVRGHNRALCPDCRADLKAATRSRHSGLSKHMQDSTCIWDNSTLLTLRQGPPRKSRRQRVRWRV